MSQGPRLADRRGGFTLLEVLIAAMLLVVGMVGSIALILGLLRGNKTARARDTGYFLAQQALDQLELVPMVGEGMQCSGGLCTANGLLMSTGQPAFLANAFPYQTTPFPSEPTCYAMSDDVVGDRPVSCAAGQGAAFVVRTWTCCSTPIGPVATPVDAIPTGASCMINAVASGDIPGAISSPDGSPTNPATGLPGGTTLNPNGAVCLVQAEVTWPVEDPIGHNLVTTLAGAQSLFQNPNPAAPPAVTYGNHVWATLVRTQ